MIQVATETWKSIAGEIEAVAAFHWEELALDKLLFKRDLDHTQYNVLDEMGRLQITAAREDGKLIGYIVCFVMPHHLHYMSSGPVALADMYFILREYRKGGLGVRMFAEMERGLKDRGVIRAHMSCKTHEPHNELFARMGWSHTDDTFSKLLVEAK